MNHKNENMDEEKSFEIIQEGEQKEFEGPHLVRRGLTEVSAMFDRNGKGYLDDTERALRRMDSQDRGYLGIDKVCVIFESLQAEQERSSQLLEALRTESKKSLNLKMGVIALTVFSVLLALANVGTSFAVSKLVKDTQVNNANGDLMVKGSSMRVATTDRLLIFEMESLDEGRRRRLQSNAGLICETMVDTITNEDGTVTYTEKECSLQGVIKKSVADDLQTQLAAIDSVVLTCNNKKSKILGTTALPDGNPGDVVMGSIPFEVTYKVYPDATDMNAKYDAMQKVYVPGVPEQRYVPEIPANAAAGQPYVPAIPYQAARMAYYCEANYDLAMYCPTELINGKEQECLVMSAFMPTEACPTRPVVCGVAPTPAPLIN